MEDITIVLKKDKETPGTWRYAEVADKDDMAIRTMYLTKWAVDSLGRPETIKVVIQPNGTP